jgi:hypothetical protein
VPNITPYSAPSNLGLAPTETGVEAAAGAARRLGAFGNQIAEARSQEGNQISGAIRAAGDAAVDYMDHREISAGAANGAQFMANMNAKWEDVAKNADPNDVTVKQKFIEENLDPALEDFKKGFNTEKSQDWAEHFTDQYRQHMFEKTAADMSTLAGVAVKVNVQKTINGLSSAVSIDPSTHSIDNAFAVLDHSVGSIVDTSPNIDATTGAKIKGEVNQAAKEQIVKAAVASMITKNPNIDLDAIQSKYGDYIKGDEMKQFQKAAQTQAKVDFLQNKAIEAYQDKQKERAAGADLSKTLSDNVQFDADGKVTVKPEFYSGVMATVKKYPGSADDTARALIQFGEHQAAVKRETIVTDPTVQSDLLGRMTDPRNPTTETQILQESNKNHLDAHATSNLLALRKSIDDAPIKDPIFHQTFESAKGVIEQSLQGQENFGKFAYSFMSAYRAASNAGTLKPDDLDMSKPDSLISKSMEQFKPTIAQRAEYHLFKNLGANPADIDFSGIGKPKAAAPVVTTKAAFDALKSGDTYTGDDGKTYRKP